MDSDSKFFLYLIGMMLAFILLACLISSLGPS